MKRDPPNWKMFFVVWWREISIWIFRIRIRLIFIYFIYRYFNRNVHWPYFFFRFCLFVWWLCADIRNKSSINNNKSICVCTQNRDKMSIWLVRVNNRANREQHINNINSSTQRLPKWILTCPALKGDFSQDLKVISCFVTRKRFLCRKIQIEVQMFSQVHHHNIKCSQCTQKHQTSCAE